MSHPQTNSLLYTSGNDKLRAYRISDRASEKILNGF